MAWSYQGNTTQSKAHIGPKILYTSLFLRSCPYGSYIAAGPSRMHWGLFKKKKNQWSTSIAHFFPFSIGMCRLFKTKQTNIGYEPQHHSQTWKSINSELLNNSENKVLSR